MASQKILGYWREDGFPNKGKLKPKRCEECRCRELDYERMSEDDECDFDLFEEWHPEQPPYPFGRSDMELFHFMPDYAVCESCGLFMDYGPDYYWNPESGMYDLPKPLTRAEAAKAEAAAEREKLLAAGQLELFKED